jgi:hypothetical protein
MQATDTDLDVAEEEGGPMPVLKLEARHNLYKQTCSNNSPKLLLGKWYHCCGLQEAGGSRIPYCGKRRLHSEESAHSHQGHQRSKGRQDY